MSADRTNRIEQIVSEIRDRIAQRANGPANGGIPVTSSAPENEALLASYRTQLRNSTAALARLDENIAQSVDRIGACPPTPPTRRGRIGATIIQNLSKLLWWQNLQIKETANLIVRRNREQSAAHQKTQEILGEAVNESLRIGSRVDRIQEDVIGLRNRLDLMDGAVSRIASTVDAISNSIREMLSTQARLSNELERVSGTHTQDIRNLSAFVQQEVTRVEDSIAAVHAPAAQRETEFIVSELERVNGMVSSLSDKVSDIGLATHRLRADLLAQAAKAGHILREVRKTKPAPETQTKHSMPDSEIDMHHLYVDFENIFRGPRDMIRERQRPYVDLLRQAGTGTAERPILDLGCGRGEWLEELRDQGLMAHGADSNVVMIELCRGLGLEVTQSEAIEHLGSLPDASLGALTAFHMIEHMPFERMVVLLDEALRVLRPEGVLILETPNPGNLAVAASTFYFDPTHVRPVPSQLLQFVADARGFCQTEIRFLHPYPESVRLPEETAYGRRFNEYFYGPQDYALIARRP